MLLCNYVLLCMHTYWLSHAGRSCRYIYIYIYIIILDCHTYISCNYWYDTIVHWELYCACNYDVNYVSCMWRSFKMVSVLIHAGTYMHAYNIIIAFSIGSPHNAQPYAFTCMIYIDLTFVYTYNTYFHVKRLTLQLLQTSCIASTLYRDQVNVVESKVTMGGIHLSTLW